MTRLLDMHPWNRLSRTFQGRRFSDRAVRLILRRTSPPIHAKMLFDRREGAERLDRASVPVGAARSNSRRSRSGGGVTFGGAPLWRQWAGHRSGGGWINPQSQPLLNRFYGPLQPVTATFIPEAGHVYEACPGGVCVPPTLLPTPAPPPAPPAPLAAMATRLALHSRYAAASSWTGTVAGSGARPMR